MAFGVLYKDEAGNESSHFALNYSKCHYFYNFPVWCEEDCRTENDLQLYQLSNGGRTATKVFPESSRILRSKEPSCQSGQQITFWVMKI